MHSQSGDKVWWFDFSSLTTSGQYYISDGSVKSEVFTIGTQVYHNVLKTAFNTFYSQRCGCAKLMTHLSDAYDDAVCHSQDVNCRFINDPNNSSQYKNMSGGWHDAGDYNKYINFAYNAVLPMLLSFEYNPQAYNDSLNIPESFNGIPDILDEVKYETDWLLKMQANDGGVYCVVGVQNFASASPPSLDVATRYYGPKTTSASFSTSAMLALTAIEFRKVNNASAQTYANTLQTAAISAWNWGVSNPSVTYYNTGIVAAGEQEVDAYERSMRKLAAAIYLYALTKDNTYKTYVEANYTSAHMLACSFVYPFETPVQLSLLYYASIPEASTAVATSIKNTYHNSMMTHADNFPAFRNKTDAYRAYLTDANHGWGSNSIKALTGNMYQAMNHYVLNSSKKDSLAMAQGGYLHYLHGANPTGLCYLTHMKDYGAENSINSIYHGWFTDGSSLWDDVRTSQHGPLPGILSGGVNPNYNLDACCPSGCGGSNNLCVTLSPPDNQPILKSYLDWNTGWPQNSWEVTENSISYQAAYLMLLSHYVDRTVPYLSNPVVSTIENANISFAINGKSLILRSPDQTWYRLSVSNTGSLSTTLIPVINGQNTRLSNTSLNVKQANSGLLIKSPDNTYWKISVDNGGNLISNSISSIPLPNASMGNGDLIIENNAQGMLLKDGDNSCYFLSVANGGKLFIKPVKCVD